MPTLDVVVPCYNYSRFLERCVRSALNQEGADVRVLIIDDCSSDESPLTGQRLANEDPRVEFRRHDENRGAVATFNEGMMDWARAEYSLLISADDAMAPGAFLRALRLFQTSADVGMVYGRGRIITHDDEFRFPANNDFTSSHIISGAEFLRFCCESCFNPVPTPTAIVRTAWQHRLGGYRSDLPHTHDLEMWIRFASHGSIGVVHSVQGEYRWHGNNMGMRYYTQVLGDRREFELTCVDALRPVLASNPDARAWLAALHEKMLSYAEECAATAFDYGDLPRYRAWHAFADEMAGHLERPWQSRRLRVRKLLGNRLWRSLRRLRRTWNPNISEAKPLDIIWSPAHGDVNGAWPRPRPA